MPAINVFSVDNEEMKSQDGPQDASQNDEMSKESYVEQEDAEQQQEPEQKD